MEAKGMNGRHAPSRRALALAMSAALGSCLGLVPGADLHAGTTFFVSNCDDSGNGSLRDAVGIAASGDTVDLTTLACSTISLASGAIVVAQESLILEGPGAQLAIDGGYADRIFRHTGTGTLFVSDVTIRSGSYASDSSAKGGCIYSAGSLSLSNAVVTQCTVLGQHPAVAMGGAISTEGGLAVLSSRITGNISQGGADSSSTSNGGAAFVRGNLTVKYSTFSDNQALPTEGRNSGAGAIETFGSATIIGSTFSNNYALFFGALAFEGSAGDDAMIVDSTISNNVAPWNSGIYTQIPLKIFNSTIAFNHSHINGAVYSQMSSLEFQSTIIAGNESSGAAADDVRGTAYTPTILGAGNLITSSNIPLPPDTITDCPRLAQLTNNGGPTLTHALLDDSPAIDAGNNVQNLTEDQRGEPRVFGPAADIGAFEWNGHVEFTFHSSFEPTCDS
jgi:hypothetical protein